MFVCSSSSPGARRTAEEERESAKDRQLGANNATRQADCDWRRLFQRGFVMDAGRSASRLYTYVLHVITLLVSDHAPLVALVV